MLYWLRETFEQEGLRGLAIDKLHVSLDPAAFTTDLDFAFKVIEEGHPIDRVASEICITDSIMSGYDDVDPSCDAWLRAMREKLCRRMIASLEGHLSDLPTHVETTKRVARALLQMDPGHEVACQHLMRAHITSGNTGGALAVYKQLWDYLEQTFDIEPAPATQALVVSIRSRECLPPSVTFEKPAVGSGLNDEEVGRAIFLAVQFATAWVNRRKAEARWQDLDHPSILQR
ncbi:MAG: hypothetical protein HC869_03120 [Rhodospirillales bacterium]|nr:hypothetical protein [Rhodospirillales bacterium]